MTTKEDIQTSINSRLTTSPTQIEGGTSQDIIGSVSYEIANIIDTLIEPVLDNAFVKTADEEHLKIRGEEVGVYRKNATCAIVYAKITGALPNTIITTELKAKTENNIVFRNFETSITDENGEATIKMICLEKGTIGNIEANSLNEFYTSYTGFLNAQITNPDFAYDGFEEENVEDYRERILEYLKDDACNSNVKDYIMWAKSVSGVKNVVVKDAFTTGAGKVGVYISALQNAPVSSELIEQVRETIEKEQIINAKVEVYPLQYLEINVSASVVLDESVNIEYVKSSLRSKMEEYFDNLSSDIVSYLYISNLIFEIGGVLDVSDYLLNNSTSGVLVNEYQIPVAGDIALV